MKIQIRLFTTLVALALPALALAQDPVAASPEHAVLKKEVGRWEAEIKMYAGPGDPQVTKGSEVNRMVGDLWLVSDFKGDMMGQDFHGHGTFGFNPQSKKYEGSWIDSFSPSVMHMVGEYDKSSKTMTYVGEGKGPDGSPMKSKLVTVMKDDGTRHMTMHAPSPDGGDAWIKVMEITYTKVKRQGKKKQN